MDCIVYTKQTYNQILQKNNESLNNEKILFLISSLIANPTSDNCSDYVTIYNQLLLQNEQSLEVIIIGASKIIENLFNKLSLSLSSLPNEAKIIYLFEEISKINLISVHLRNLLLTSSSRFNLNLLKTINSMINIKPFFSQFQIKESKIFVDIYSYILSIKDERDKVIQYMGIISKVFSKQLFIKLIDSLSTDFINKYQKEVNEISINECQILIDFFQKYSKQINEDVYYFKLLFGEQEANIFNEKLLKVVFMNKISDELIKNESFLSKLLEEEDYSTLHILLNLVRKNVQIGKQFGKTFFDFYYLQFLKNKHFSNLTSIKEGQIYLQYLIDKIDKLMMLFRDIFQNEKIYQMKYNEVLTKMANCKEIKNVHILIVIYINLHIKSKNEKKNDLIYNPAFLVLLKNLNEKELLFSLFEKFLIKRITTFNFHIDREKQFVSYLKLHFEIRHIIKIERMIKDIIENKSLSMNNNLIDFYLFSYNGINSHDLVTVISKQNVDLLSIAKSYTSKYPHRQVSISQNLSIALVLFNKKADIAVNYIQAEIVLLFNKKTEKGISYEEIKTLLVDNNKQISLFRSNIYALIECKILKTSGKENELINNDVLSPNLEYNGTKVLFCFEKVNQFLQKGSITEEHLINHSTANYECIVIANKIHIVDCAIMKLLKHSSEVIAESDLVKLLVTNDLIQKLIEEQEIGLFIKRRIETLVDKGFVHIKVIDNKINYSYFSS